MSLSHDEPCAVWPDGCTIALFSPQPLHHRQNAHGQQPRADVLIPPTCAPLEFILYKNHTWSYLKDGWRRFKRQCGRAAFLIRRGSAIRIFVYGKTKIPFDTSNRYDINLLENESEFCIPVEGHVVRGKDYRHDGGRHFHGDGRYRPCGFERQGAATQCTIRAAMAISSSCAI